MEISELTYLQLTKVTALEKKQSEESQTHNKKFSELFKRDNSPEIKKQQIEEYKIMKANHAAERKSMVERHEKEYQTLLTVKTIIKESKINSDEIEKEAVQKLTDKSSENKITTTERMQETEDKNSFKKTNSEPEDTNTYNPDKSSQEIIQTEYKKNSEISVDRELTADELLDKRVAERLKQFSENKNDYTRE